MAPEFFDRPVRHWWFAAVVVLVLAGAAEARAGKVTTYFVIDAANGNVLAQSHPDKPMYPASLAKMMTLYLVFEALEDGTITPETPFGFSRKASGQQPSKLGIPRGQSIAAGDAILALMIKSANDVAVAVAEGLGDGDEWRFAAKMTRKARELGMRNTTFTNASGLHQEDMLSTARDIAILALRLQHDFPDYYHLFSTPQFTYAGTTYKSHNKLLGKVAGVDGLKTGYTSRAGWNLAASSLVDGRRIVAVVMGGRDRHARDRLMTRLLQEGIVTAEARSRDVPPPAAHPGRDGGQTRLAMFDGDLDADEFVAALADSLGLNPRSTGVDQGSAADDQSWAIQVGAYSRKDNALRAGENAGRLLETLLAGDGSAVTAAVDSGGTTLYRVRVIYLTEDQARRGCGILIGHSLPCSVLHIGG